LKDWRNPTYWTNLKIECKARNRNKFNIELNKYLKTVQEHSDNVHKIINDSLVLNWCKNTITTPNAKLDQKVQIHPLVMDALAHTSIRKCRITGIDISNQKEGSYYLRESTIKRIYLENQVLYKRLKSEFGPRKKQITTLKAEFEAIAKNIRNRDSNPRKRERDIFNRFKNSLFPYEPRIPLYARV
jgi:ribosomal protein S19E (S16A)